MDIEYEFYFGRNTYPGYYTVKDEDKCAWCGGSNVEYEYSGFKFCVLCYSQIEEEV